MEKIQAMLEKYNYFKMDQINAIERPDEDTIVVKMIVQNDDGEDVVAVNLKFNGIKEKRLLVNHALAFLDTMSGISIVYEREHYGFGIGNCPAMLNVISAPLFVVAKALEVEEITL